MLRLLILFTALVGFQIAQASETQIIWHGHAAFEIITPKGKVLMIDPWLGNPANPDAKGGKNPAHLVKKLDYILITHGHSDHVGDSVELGKKTGAKLISNFELANNLVQVFGYPTSQAGMDTMINIGGEITIADGEVKVAMTPAVHSSGMNDPKPKHPMLYGGNPGGIVLIIKDGPTLYHTGDTAYFKDMEVIGETYSPDLALINIGGHFGMNPEMAAKAALSVRAKRVVPHHYKTFPILTQDAGPFVEDLKKVNIPTSVLEPGQKLVFDGRKLKEN